MSEVMHATVGQIDKVNTHLGVVDSNLCWHDSRISLLEGLSRELSYTIDCYITPCLCGLYDDIYNPDDGLEHKLANVVKIYGQIDCDIGGIRDCLTSVQNDIDKVKNDASADLENAINDLSTRIDNIPTEYPYLPLDVTCDTNVTVGKQNTLSFVYYCDYIPDSPLPLFQIGVANGEHEQNIITIGDENSNTDIRIIGITSVCTSTFSVEADSEFNGCVHFCGSTYFEGGIRSEYTCFYGHVDFFRGVSFYKGEESNYESFLNTCDSTITIDGEYTEVNLIYGATMNFKEGSTLAMNCGSHMRFDCGSSVEFSCGSSFTFCVDITADSITSSSISIYDYSCGCNYVGGLESCGNCLILHSNNLDIKADYSISIGSCGKAISLSQNGIFIDGNTNFCGDLWFKHTPVGCGGSNMVNLSDTINELLQSSSGSNEFDYVVVKAGRGSVSDSNGIDFCAGEYHTCFGNSNAYIMGSFIGGCTGCVAIDMYASDGINMQSHVNFECGVTFSQCDTITFNGSADFNCSVNFRAGTSINIFGSPPDFTEMRFFGGSALFFYDSSAIEYSCGSYGRFGCGAYERFGCGANLIIDNGAEMKFYGGVDNCGQPTGETLTLDYATVKKLLALLPA